MRRGPRSGAASPPARLGLVRVLPDESGNARTYCAGCAGPIESEMVARGAQAYYSIACSLGGDHPA